MENLITAIRNKDIGDVEINGKDDVDKRFEIIDKQLLSDLLLNLNGQHGR